jgi:hypothetical protein
MVSEKGCNVGSIPAPCFIFLQGVNMITFIMQVVNVVLAIFMVFAMATAPRDERLIPIIMIIIHMLNFCVIGGVLK